MSFYDKLRKLYGLQGYPVTSAQHGHLSDALTVDRIAEGLEHLASDARMITAAGDRVRRTPSNVALASQNTATGSVQIREVPAIDSEVQRPVIDPEADARRRQQLAEYQKGAQAEREQAEHDRQRNWREYRTNALAAQQRARREELLNGDPMVVKPFIDYALPLAPPSWFGHRDGTVRYFAPIQDQSVTKNADGTTTIRARNPFRRAPVEKTPEQKFAEAR